MRVTEEMEAAIKKALNYQEAERCCKTCRYFVPDDCSGSMSAKPRHCTFNPSFDVPVDEGGRCDQYAAKQKG